LEIVAWKFVYLVSLSYFLLETTRNVRKRKKSCLQIITAFVISDDYWRLNAILKRRSSEDEYTKLYIELTLRNIETQNST
jgi:hypothetical protein